MLLCPIKKDKFEKRISKINALKGMQSEECYRLWINYSLLIYGI
jgi:hypothetical protein